MRIEVVPDENCPRCGGTGSPKVCDSDGVWHWKCLTPSCTLAYWVPGVPGMEEERLTGAALKESHDRVAAWVDELMSGKEFVEVAPGEFALRPTT